jgi:hypothetical protein
MKNTTNLYPTKREGYYIYKRGDRYDKWFAQKKWPSGERKSATFYSVEEAIAWIDALP